MTRLLRIVKTIEDYFGVFGVHYSTVNRTARWFEQGRTGNPD